VPQRPDLPNAPCQLSNDLPVLRKNLQQFLAPRESEISEIKARCHRATDQ
jgi:hypothetical protein